jgi:hypothetical protein
MAFQLPAMERSSADPHPDISLFGLFKDKKFKLPLRLLGF